MKLDALRKPRELKFLLKHLHLHFYSVEFNLASYSHHTNAHAFVWWLSACVIMVKWSMCFFCSFRLSQLLCSFWWITLSHRLQRSVYSLGIQQPQWINGRWECSNRALGSIHQTEDAEKETPPVLVLESVWMFVQPFLVLCLRPHVRGFVYFCVHGYQNKCISVFLSAYYRLRVCWHRQIKNLDFS